jgi:hypothetical protein
MAESRENSSVPPEQQPERDATTTDSTVAGAPPEQSRSDPEASTAFQEAPGTTPQQPTGQGTATRAPAGGWSPAYVRDRREPPPRRRPSRLHSVLVGILIFVTCVSAFASTVTIWSHQTVLNTDRFVATLKPVINDPQFANTISGYVTDQLVTSLNVQQRVAKALPPQQAFLAVPLTTVFSNTTHTIVNRVLSSAAFQRTWPVVLGKVHSQLVALLRGDTKNVVIENNQLQLNLFPVIVRALTRLQAIAPGLIKFKAPLPTETEAKSPAVARQQLSQALGRTLPPTFGTITIATSNQLGTAQQIVKLFDFLVIALPVLTVVLAALALLVSRDRRRTLIELGIGLVVTFLLAWVLIEAAKDRIDAAVKSGTARELVQSALPKILDGLENLAIFLTVIGVLVAAGAYLAGRPAWFMRLLAHFQHGTQPA